MARTAGDPLTAIRSLVDASLEKGELSYFHAFKDTRSWDCEPGTPALLSTQASPLHPEVQRLVDAQQEEAQRGLVQLSDPDMLGNLGGEWLRRQRFDLATAALHRAVDAAAVSKDLEAPLSDRAARLLAQRSAARRGAGDLEGALEDAERCSRALRDWAYGHFLRGRALADLRRYEDANKAYKKAATLEEDAGARARILEAQDLLAPHLLWGEDISPEGDGSALLRVVRRGDAPRPLAEDLCRIRCHCRLHDQSDEARRFDGSEPGRVRWSSYATQQGVAYEYARDDPDKDPLEWVLGEDEPPFPLLDAVVRHLRAGGEAKVRLSGKGALGRGLPVRGACDAYIYLVGVAPACRGPDDAEEWLGLRSVAEQLARGAVLLGRAAEVLRASGPAADVARHAARAEARYASSSAWLQQGWAALEAEDPARADELRLRGLCGEARAALWKHEALAAEAAGAAASDACTGLARAARGRVARVAPRDAAVQRAAELAGRAVELSGRKSVAALHVLGLACIASGDDKGAQAALEEALRLQTDASTPAVRDALVRLRGLERDARGEHARAAAEKARDQLEAALAAKGVPAAEAAVRELLAALAAGLPYEAAAALKIGKLAATAARDMPGGGAATAAAELIGQLRRMAMAQGRQ